MEVEFGDWLKRNYSYGMQFFARFPRPQSLEEVQP